MTPGTLPGPLPAWQPVRKGEEVTGETPCREPDVAERRGDVEIENTLKCNHI